jgi:hypothetical protein
MNAISNITPQTKISALRKGDVVTIKGTEFTIIKKGKGYGQGETRIVYNEFPDDEGFEKIATFAAGATMADF